MLPRNLLSTAARAAARRRVQVPPSRISQVHPVGLQLTNSVLYIRATAQFHSSARRLNEIPKSPFQTFVDVLKDELRKNRELAENVKQLQGDVDKFQDSEAMKKAKDAYERARLASSIKENPKLRAAAEELRKAGVQVGDAVSEALKSMEESDLMRAISRATARVSSTIEKTTEPIRNTAAYKSLADTIVDALDDSGTAKHAGFEEKELRRRRRQLRLAKAGQEGRAGKIGRVKANPDAGGSVVVHKLSARHQAWEDMKSSNSVLRKFSEFKQAYDESENSFVSGLRSVTDTIGSWFDENETAQVLRTMKNMDPDFSRESFERELREYIVPEVVDAYLSADRDSLKVWCGEATYNVLWATMEVYLSRGLVSASKVLDIRQVDVTSGKMLENEVPVFVVTFATQEVLCFKNAKTGEVVVGAEDRVEQCHYAAVITRVEDEIENELTAGWKIVEMARRSARAYL